MTAPPLSTGEYATWRELARRARRSWGRGNGIPQTTSLANEVYLRLAKARNLVLEDGRVPRATVFLYMKRVLVDVHRQRSALKRGGAGPSSPLPQSGEPAAQGRPSHLEIDDAIESLRRIRPRQARVVELVLAFLTLAEVAEAIGHCERLVGAEWREGRAWVAEKLGL